jgi:hypothetical protein
MQSKISKSRDRIYGETALVLKDPTRWASYHQEILDPQFKKI